MKKIAQAVGRFSLGAHTHASAPSDSAAEFDDEAEEDDESMDDELLRLEQLRFEQVS